MAFDEGLAGDPRQTVGQHALLVDPTVTRLNLGCGPNLLPNFDNLDASTGWHFEEGLGQYADGSVEGISVSHTLMYVTFEVWPIVFSELARVLEPGGIVRITEDDTANPDSERYGGWHDAVTLTSPKLVAQHLRKAKLKPIVQLARTTAFKDESLLQHWHGAPPKVFFCEGIKPNA